MRNNCPSYGRIKPVTAAAAAAPAAPAPKPSLSEAAAKELALAEADVKAAKAQGSLWTTSVDALKKAKEAAAAFDSAAVIKNARIASEQAQLSVAQTKYPSTK